MANKKLNLKPIKITAEEKAQFNKLYYETLLKTFKENDLGIFNNRYGYTNYIIGHKKNTKHNLELIDNETIKHTLENVLDTKEISWNNVEKEEKLKFFTSLYETSDEIQKKIITSHQLVTNRVLDIIELYPDDIEKKKDLIENSIYFYINGVSSYSLPSTLSSIVNSWKEKYSYDDYSTLVKALFSSCKGLFHKEKVKAAFRMVLSKHITEQELYNEVKEYIKEDIEVSNLFVNDTHDIYEIVVNKSTLKKIVNFSHTYDYNRMHTSLVQIFNTANVKNLLKLYSVEEPKNKDSKAYIFLVRTEKESHFTKEKLQKLLVKMYQSYAEMWNKNGHPNIGTELTDKWISYLHLSDTVQDKTNVTNKRNKL